MFTAPAGPMMLFFRFSAADGHGVTAYDTVAVFIQAGGTIEPGPTSIVQGINANILAGSPSVLEDTTQDFLAAGVDYGIQAVAASQLELDADPGESQFYDVSYIVLRP